MLYFLFQIYLIILLYVCNANALRVVQIITFGTLGTVVGSVCVSVKSHLTYGASVRPENAVTYSAGNEGQKMCGVFSETAPLQRSSTPSIVRPCVQSRKARMPIIVWASPRPLFSRPGV